ncbi:MAG: YtxH domain-containing protein [Mangrovibacterium sp.]
MSSGKVILGFLAGAAAGAVLGILFAPDKGSETRKKIADKGEELVDGAKEKVSKLMDDLHAQVDSAKEKVKDLESKLHKKAKEETA